LLALVALAAAISEEIVFRSIVISHIEAATGSTRLAAAVSLATFAFAHLGGWGWSQVLFAAVPGVVLVTFFVWKRNLAVVIIAHFLTDLVGLLGAAAAHAQGLHPG
jgi:membrane protease YdiL (CAAX protease family)